MKEIAIMSDLFTTLPLIVMAIRGIHLTSALNRYIYIYLILLFIKSSTTVIMSYSGIRNIYIYNWHSIISYFILALIYRNELKNRYAKIGILLSIVIISIIPLIETNSFFNIQTINFSHYSHNITAAFSIIIILLYFYQLIQDLPTYDLTQYPMFWFTAGTLLYYAGTIFSNLFMQTTLNDLHVREEYWMLEAIFSIILSCALGMSVWHIKPQKM